MAKKAKPGDHDPERTPKPTPRKEIEPINEDDLLADLDLDSLMDDAPSIEVEPDSEELVLDDDLVAAEEDELIVEEEVVAAEEDELVATDDLLAEDDEPMEKAAVKTKLVSADDLLAAEEDLIIEEEDDEKSVEVSVDDIDDDEKSVEVSVEDLDLDAEAVDVDDDAVEVDDDAVEVDTDGDPMSYDGDASLDEAETQAMMPALDSDDPFAGVEAEDEDADALVGAGVPGAGLDDELLYQEEEIPKPRTHWFTYTLIGFNVIAALAFPYLLVMDYQKRQEYAFAVFKHDLAIGGLPTEEEEEATTAAKATLPNHRLSANQIKKIVTDRIGPVSDPFPPMDEAIIKRLPPSILDEDMLKEHFGEHYLKDGGTLIKTVEDEIRRIDKNVVNDMKAAAKDAYGLLGNDDAKRTKIERLLLPLAMNGFQAKDLDKRIKAAAGKDLEDLYMEAALRRMAFDFLLPLEFFRPGDVKVVFIENIGNLDPKDGLPLAKVLDRVSERVKSTIEKTYQPNVHLGEDWANKERDTIEKRLSASFTLVSLAHVKRPDNDYLYPKLFDRIPFVMGQYDFTMACSLYPSRIMTMNDRLVELLRIDREGVDVSDKDGKVFRIRAFIDAYEEELQRIRFVQQDIFKAQIRLKDLQDQKKRYDTLLTERTKQRDDVLAAVSKARIKTAKDAEELRIFRDELFRYQIGLATSEEDLAKANQAINDKLGRKGGK